MEKNKYTIDKFLDGINLNEKGIEAFDVFNSIKTIRDVVGKIPANGEYDPAIVSIRIGQYIHAIKECGRFLSTLSHIHNVQEIEVEREFANAALTRAAEAGYKTAAEKKLFAQTDEKYILSKNKLSEIQAVIMYIENCQKSLNLAHMHCKKILDRDKIEARFANDHERFYDKQPNWINEEELK